MQAPVAVRSGLNPYLAVSFEELNLKKEDRGQEEGRQEGKNPVWYMKQKREEALTEKLTKNLKGKKDLEIKQEKWKQKIILLIRKKNNVLQDSGQD